MTFNIEVNGRGIQVRRGDTILESLSKNGIKVPTLCSMKDLSPTGACRLCVVEVEGRTNLVTACSNQVEEGMRIATHSPRVVKARKALLELLLSNHPDDCLYCERNGSCELQDLAVDFNIRERKVSGRKIRHRLDLSSPGVVRDPAKCILCGRCIRVCDEIQSVSTLEFINRGARTQVGIAMNHDLNFSTCIACGQCVMVCPTGALCGRSNLDEVQDALNNPSLTAVVQYAPSVTVSLAEEFGLKPGRDVNGLVVSALKKIGFKNVFDTSFGADLIIMETAHELSQKLASKGTFPLFSSSCPAWVRFMEQFYPQMLPNLSTLKSPQQALGSVIKSVFAGQQKINPASIYSVAIMPCLAKKNESQRVEMTTRGLSEVDVVLSTRELIRMIRLYGIDMDNIQPQQADSPFGTRSSAGKLFGASGGETEGTLRTLHFMRTGKDLATPKILDLRSAGNGKVVEVKVGKEKINLMLISGLTDIRRLMASITESQVPIHFVEVMACPGGCVNGGGQPFANFERTLKARSKALYDLDDAELVRFAHRNPQLVELYQEHLQSPGSEKALKMLRVKYSVKKTEE